MRPFPQFERGDFVYYTQQINPVIEGKIIYSFIHEQQKARYYQLDRHAEPIHESKLGLILSKKDLESDKN